MFVGYRSRRASLVGIDRKRGCMSRRRHHMRYAHACHDIGGCMLLPSESGKCKTIWSCAMGYETTRGCLKRLECARFGVTSVVFVVKRFVRVNNALLSNSVKGSLWSEVKWKNAVVEGCRSFHPLPQPNGATAQVNRNPAMQSAGQSGASD